MVHSSTLGTYLLETIVRLRALILKSECVRLPKC